MLEGKPPLVKIGRPRDVPREILEEIQKENTFLAGVSFGLTNYWLRAAINRNLEIKGAEDPTLPPVTLTILSSKTIGDCMTEFFQDTSCRLEHNLSCRLIKNSSSELILSCSRI